MKKLPRVWIFRLRSVSDKLYGMYIVKNPKQDTCKMTSSFLGLHWVTSEVHLYILVVRMLLSPTLILVLSVDESALPFPRRNIHALVQG